MDQQLKCYLVGGAVRDALLGRPVGDRDFVVVGSSPQQMEQLGFTLVGRDFPVYLHPETHEEYALARTERKSGVGHRGFEVNAAGNVSLEEDLLRRDLTINAIAQDEQGNLIDPFGGMRDLRARVLRHVSDAFAEDPLRVFRVARFAAMLPDFDVAADTEALMRSMAAGGALRELSAERVWSEVERALSEAAPQRFFAVLDACDCLGDWLAELDGRRLVFHAQDALSRFAELPLDEAEFTQLLARLKAPKVYLQAALDRLRWGEVVTDWLHVQPSLLNDAFVALKVNHEPARLERLVALLWAQHEFDAAGVLALARAWSGVKSPAGNLQGPAAGAALNTARVEFLDSARVD